MIRIIRIFIVNDGKRETFAFDLGAFVSYNIDTRELTLTSGSVFVHKDSEDAVIRSYRLLDSDDESADLSSYYEAYNHVVEENETLRRKLEERHGFFDRFRR